MKELRVRSHLAFAFAFGFAMFSFDVFRRLKQATLQEMGSVHICALYPVADTGFPVAGGGGGGSDLLGGSTNLWSGQFSVEMCAKTKKIGSHWGRGVYRRRPLDSPMVSCDATWHDTCFTANANVRCERTPRGIVKGNLGLVVNLFIQKSNIYIISIRVSREYTKVSQYEKLSNASNI